MSETEAAIRTRFAPSPTGDLHLGHARTHLVTWLLARKVSGSIVMRIEDLDGPRVKEGSADAILFDHEWLGLTWDEGPLYQSTRFDAYADAIEALGDRVYPCTCTRKEIVASAPHGELAIYPGTCRKGVTHPERDAALRFRLPDEPRGFRDRIAGDVPALRDGDFVLRRKDGVYAYQLAVVVDDAYSEINLIVRGDDLIPSTPRQIALYEALDLAVPEFAHVPLVHDANGKRFSKRAGSLSLRELREQGVTPEELLGRLARSLGVDHEGPIALDELLERFELERVPRGATRM